ncbi:unnamed protein product [Moneuplotes crassus]|uniref:non-specific serine/threonine protein kinase n=1 Tax=Euplotes crassus TaxID=5936 RepID=A0AAD1U309_EUPCR|nr:unnamed protein product [Moneuplotes crassus]
MSKVKTKPKTKLSDFEIITKLGDGSYSNVYKVRRLADHKIYCIKKVKLSGLSDKEKQNALNEVRILAKIKHPNIISYKEAFLDKESVSLCLVLEYADDKDLYKKIKSKKAQEELYEEDDIWYIFLQILKGLKALHDKKIMHRDLKSANVFMSKDLTAKLGDMNVSRLADTNGLNYTQTGTPYYASPEVWKDKPYDFKNDIWALGCVLYEITCLEPPFKSPNMEQLYEKVMKGLYPRIPKCYSQDLAIVIKSMLQVKTKYRPTVDELMKHDIIKSRLNELNLDESGSDDSVENSDMENLNNNYTNKLPLPNYAPILTDRDILCVSDPVDNEPLKPQNVTIDDYNMEVVNNAKPLFLHKSIEEPQNINEKHNFSMKNSVPGTLASRKLLTSLKKHIKRTNRYKSSIRADNSLPYNFKQHYKDLISINRSSKESLRSISDRTSMATNRFGLQRRSNNLEAPMQSYALRMDKHHMQLPKTSARKGNKRLTKAHSSSQKRLENHKSTDILKETSQQTDQRIRQFSKGIRVNQRGDKEISPSAMERIFNRIDRHLENYPASKSSSRNLQAKKTEDRSLILPNLNKKPSGYQSIQSNDIKHARMKEKSLNYIRRIPADHHSSKMSALSIRETPIPKRKSKRKSRKLGITNAKIHEITTREEDLQDHPSKSVSLIASNKNMLHERFRKLLRDNKKRSIGLHQ